MMNKLSVGVIAEDHSDVDVIFALLSRINSRVRYSKLRFAAFGCGRLRNKLSSWAENLAQRGCNRLIVVHDLDRNEHPTLLADLTQRISDAGISRKIVVIPIEELEAWFFADPNAIRSVFALKKTPSAVANPERVTSPKESLARLVYSSSNRERRYLNTKHNEALAKVIDLTQLKSRCPSARPLFDLFVD